MTDWQIALLGISFVLSIVNLIFFIVSFKVDGETDEDYREYFLWIISRLNNLESHKQKVEKVLKLEKD